MTDVLYLVTEHLAGCTELFIHFNIDQAWLLFFTGFGPAYNPRRHISQNGYVIFTFLFINI